jgi:large subunit ribosomal protein L1
MQRSKSYRTAAEAIDQDAVYTPLEAVRLAKAGSRKKFDNAMKIIEGTARSMGVTVEG